MAAFARAPHMSGGTAQFLQGASAAGRKMDVHSDSVYAVLRTAMPVFYRRVAKTKGRTVMLQKNKLIL